MFKYIIEMIQHYVFCFGLTGIMFWNGKSISMSTKSVPSSWWDLLWILCVGWVFISFPLLFHDHHLFQNSHSLYIWQERTCLSLVSMLEVTHSVSLVKWEHHTWTNRIRRQCASNAEFVTQVIISTPFTFTHNYSKY